MASSQGELLAHCSEQAVIHNTPNGEHHFASQSPCPNAYCCGSEGREIVVGAVVAGGIAEGQADILTPKQHCRCYRQCQLHIKVGQRLPRRGHIITAAAALGRIPDTPTAPASA